MTHFRFSTYDKNDLKSCAAAFALAAKAFTDLDPYDKGPTKLWTNFVLDWFAATAPPGIVVDASASPKPGRGHPTAISKGVRALAPARQTSGEFLLDLAHHDYPPYEEDPFYGTFEFWKKAYSNNRTFRLALESEWGKENSAGATIGMVMEDASKLFHVVANCKVVVFASHNDEQHAQLMELGQAMARQDTVSSWLWFDIPWEGRPPKHATF